MLDRQIITIILAAVCSFALALLAGRLVIPALRALKAGQSIREIGPSWHNSKAGTPTMGGIAFIAGCIFNGRWYVGAAVLLSGFAIRACFEVGRKTMIFAVTMFGSGLAATLAAAVVHRLKHRIPKVLVDAILIWCSCFAGLTGSGVINEPGNDVNYATGAARAVMWLNCN